MSLVLHYVYDPLCGWCYAAERMIEAVAEHASEQCHIVLHGGGLFTRTQLPAAMREHIRESDKRIGALSGQVFGNAYLNRLLSDPATIYDSQPPIAAILAAQALQADKGLAMLKTIQHAHYRYGRHVSEPDVLLDLAESIGLGRAAFSAAYADAEQHIHQHLAETEMLMNHAAVRGFPTFVLQLGDHWKTLRHEAYYANPDAFVTLISRQTDKP